MERHKQTAATFYAACRNCNYKIA